jgi:hypothetical protein
VRASELPGGASVYVASNGGNAVVHFNRAASGQETKRLSSGSLVSAFELRASRPPRAALSLSTEAVAQRSGRWRRSKLCAGLFLAGPLWARLAAIKDRPGVICPPEKSTRWARSQRKGADPGICATATRESGRLDDRAQRCPLWTKSKRADASSRRDHFAGEAGTSARPRHLSGQINHLIPSDSLRRRATVRATVIPPCTRPF